MGRVRIQIKIKRIRPGAAARTRTRVRTRDVRSHDGHGAHEKKTCEHVCAVLAGLENAHTRAPMSSQEGTFANTPRRAYSISCWARVHTRRRVRTHENTCSLDLGVGRCAQNAQRVRMFLFDLMLGTCEHEHAQVHACAHVRVSLIGRRARRTHTHPPTLPHTPLHRCFQHKP